LTAGNDYIIIFDTLLNAFGPQRWWPSDTADETVMGAILTQNVAWTNVEKALHHLKKNNLYTLKDILEISNEKLADLILPARFSRQKAVYLKEFSLFLQKYDYDYTNLKQEFDLKELRKKLLEIKGVGNETADSILLYAFMLPVFVIDVYTKRVFFRIGLSPDENIGYAELQNLFHLNLKRDVGLFNEYHALIVKLCKDTCLKKNPKCADCPLNQICLKKGF